MKAPWEGAQHSLFDAHAKSYVRTVMGTPLAWLGNPSSIQIVSAPPRGMWEGGFTCQAIDLDECRDNDGQDSLPISNLSLSQEAPVLSPLGLLGLVTSVFWVHVHQDEQNHWWLEAP